MSDDNYIVRPLLNFQDFRLRKREKHSGKYRKIRKGLRTLHNLELMAANIYKFQITKKDSELNRQLVSAMANEITHYQDFQIKLYEYGWKPFKLRWTWWIAGFVFGFGSRLLGQKKILKTGIWVETKAVHHYGELLETIDWDNDTRKVIEKNRNDEVIHVLHWENLLKGSL